MNYNIMNIILDKVALKEWQEKIENIHKELDEKYTISSSNDGSNHLFVSRFNCDYDGDFYYIRNIYIKYCQYCNNGVIILYNYRHTDDGMYEKDDYIYVNELRCNCNTYIENIKLPKNYW